MEWLFSLLLAAWILRQSARISALEREIAALRQRRAEQPAPKSAPPIPAPQQAAPARPGDEREEREPLLLDTPLPPLFFAERSQPRDQREPLVLDTPIPVASNESDQVLTSAFDRVPRRDIVVTPVAPVRAGQVGQPAAFAQWIAESGSPWLAGGAFLFAIFFFLAAAQNWLAPTLQLAGAAIVGVAMLGASEILRRKRNASMAALLAGAGALTLYVTAWAAYGVYHFIAWPMAAAVLTLFAIALSSLSFLHGEALGALAIIAALLTPTIAGGRSWPETAIVLYVIAVAVAGFAAAWRKRWGWIAAIGLGGLYFWFAGAIAAEELNRAMTLLGVASVGALTLAMRPPANAGDGGALPWRRATALGPTVAICVGSVLMLWVWASAAFWRSGDIAAPAAMSVLHVALAGYALRLRKLSPAAFAVATGSLVAGVALYLTTRAPLAPLGGDFQVSVLAASAATALAALGARARSHARNMIASAGASGATLLALFSATTRANWHSLAAWAPLLASAVALFACAWRMALSARDEKSDWAVDVWAAGSAALLLIGVESAWAPAMRTAGDAAAALLIAAAYWWRGWRMARFALLLAAGLSIAHALSPDLIATTLTGELALWRALLIVTTAAAPLLAASLLIGQREPNGVTSPLLSTASLTIAIAGLFLTLRWLASASAHGALDALSEAALRVLILMMAGYLSLPQAGTGSGAIARRRSHLLIGAGLAYGLFEPGLIANPWWGLSPQAVTGAPFLDALLLAFAAPTAIAFVLAQRLYANERNLARIYAASGCVFALLWAVLALRRAFHPSAMSVDAVGVFESACYGLLLIGFALLVALAARLSEGRDRPFAADLRQSARVLTWACLGAATWIMVLTRHPWWGLPGAGDGLSRALATIGEAWAATLAFALGRAISRTEGVDPTRFAAAGAAVVFTWSFGHAAIQLAPLGGLGPFAHALWPLVLVIGGSAITAHAPGRHAVRAFLDDFDAIWATAIWPALAFSALGLWFLFNPWWGVAPSHASGALRLLGLASYPLAGWLGLRAPGLRGVRWKATLGPAATAACVVHIFVAATLMMRVLYHGEDMTRVGADAQEMWSYSALWAIYGAGLIVIGAFRGGQTLVVCGLALLTVTVVKVLAFDTAQLSPLLRAGSAVGLGVAALTLAWGAQRLNRAPQPGDLLKIIPPRRDLRHVRSRRRR